jgi:2-dehydro-3-deoxy-D-arabinonate dehydratase
MSSSFGGFELRRVVLNDETKPNWVLWGRESESEAPQVLKVFPMGITLEEIWAMSFDEITEIDKETRAVTNLLAPVDHQDVWACGVTYFSSKLARDEESDGKMDIYERVYKGSRIQVFPKSTASRVVGPGGKMKLRGDSKWIVPEPELVLVLDSNGQIRGWTAGNDMSCRDIEGDNPLYQPQAKIWDGSCALGPAIAIAKTVEPLTKLPIRLSIEGKDKKSLFTGESNSSQIVRKFADMVKTLFTYRTFPHGAFLFTGTGVVPPGSFSLEHGQTVTVQIGSMDPLTNEVVSE